MSQPTMMLPGNSLEGVTRVRYELGHPMSNSTESKLPSLVALSVGVVFFWLFCAYQVDPHGISLWSGFLGGAALLLVLLLGWGLGFGLSLGLRKMGRPNRFSRIIGLVLGLGFSFASGALGGYGDDHGWPHLVSKMLPVVLSTFSFVSFYVALPPSENAESTRVRS